MSVFLNLSLSVRQPDRLSLCMSVRLNISVCLCQSLAICLSLSVRQPDRRCLHDCSSECLCLGRHLVLSVCCLYLSVPFSLVIHPPGSAYVLTVRLLLSVCLSLSPCLSSRSPCLSSLSPCLSASLSYLSTHLCLPVGLPVSLHAHLSLCLFVSPSTCLTLTVCRSVSLSTWAVGLSLSMPVFPSLVCLSICS